LQNGFLTFSDVAQAVSGRDVEEVFSTLQSDLEMAERYGIKINIQPLGAKNPAQPEVNDGTDDNDE
jgi:capsid protein